MILANLDVPTLPPGGPSTYSPAMRRLLLILALAALGSSTAPLARPLQDASFANPVLDADFPDPTVIRVPGGYYAYATQTQRDGKWINIQLARSTDLVHWRYGGDALPAKPRWAATTQDFWAPHVEHVGKRWVMYYSAKPDNSDERHGLCLGVATAASAAGPFVDVGRPLLCGAGFVNIDPMAFRDPATGKHLLYWGSGFEPLKVQQLAPDGMSFARGSRPKNLVWPNPTKGAFPVLVEGSWVVRHGGYYFLFYSGDNCCGPKANYAVMVARSRRATGPFQTLQRATGKQHSIILEKSWRWIAPGHNSVVTDKAGQDWIVYHAVDALRPRTQPSDELNTRRVMLIDRIVWKNGWPEIAPPSDKRQAAPR